MVQANEIKAKAQAEKNAVAAAEKARKEAAEWMEGADVRGLKRWVARVPVSTVNRQIVATRSTLS